MTMQSAPTGMQPVGDVTDEAMVALATTEMPGAILQASGMATDGEDQFTHDAAAINAVIVQTNHDADGGGDRPPTPADRATASQELHEDSVHQAHAIPRPSVAPDYGHESVGAVEDDPRDAEQIQRPDVPDDEAEPPYGQRQGRPSDREMMKLAFERRAERDAERKQTFDERLNAVLTKPSRRDSAPVTDVQSSCQPQITVGDEGSTLPAEITSVIKPTAVGDDEGDGHETNDGATESPSAQVGTVAEDEIVGIPDPDDRPPTPEEQDAVGRELSALFEQCDREAEANSQPPDGTAVVAGPTGDVIGETAAANEMADGAEAVAMPGDLAAADEPTELAVPESQPEWGVAPDDFHAGSSDDTSDDEDSQQPDIPGGEADGSPDSETPEPEVEDVATPSTDDAGDKAESPQPYRRTPLPSDVDWRDLKPRCYGNALPPLDSTERQGLKASIVNRGFLGKILIDEWLAIVDGNTRWIICLETGIAPDVEVISGLSDEEKEELALSCNLDRRQLKDPEVEQQVLDARFENMFKLREKDGKTWTQERIAATLGVSVSTVSSREQLRHNSSDGNVSKPDARRRYEADIELEAVRLVKEGIPPSTVARMLLMHPKAVQRAVNKEKRREAGGAAAKGGKSQQVAATQLTEDLAASDGVPEPHRSSLKHLNKDATAFTEWLKSTAEQARKDSEAAFAGADSELAAVDDLEELNKSILYHIQRANLETARLRQIVSGGGEAKVQEAPPADSGSDVAGPTRVGDCLRGIVESNEAGEVFVALPVFGGGVIDNSNDFLAIYGPPEAGQAVRVRVVGFDRKRGLWKLQPLGQQTAMPTDSAAASGPSHDVSTPDAEAAACEADTETTEVSA